MSVTLQMCETKFCKGSCGCSNLTSYFAYLLGCSSLVSWLIEMSHRCSFGAITVVKIAVPRVMQVAEAVDSESISNCVADYCR